MRTPLDALVTQKALERISGGYDLLGLVCEDRLDANLPLKNVCAKVSFELAGQIDRVCALLDVSKRRFLEAAFIEAVSRADEIMEAEGVYEVYGRKDREESHHAQA